MDTLAGPLSSDSPSISSVVSALNDILLCPICHNLLTSPVLFAFSCGHSFCLSCVQDLQRSLASPSASSSGKTRSTAPTSSANAVACPSDGCTHRVSRSAAIKAAPVKNKVLEEVVVKCKAIRGRLAALEAGNNTNVPDTSSKRKSTTQGGGGNGFDTVRKKRKQNKEGRAPVTIADSSHKEVMVIPASDGEEEEEAMLAVDDRAPPSLPTLSSGSPRSLSPVSDSDSDDEAISYRLLVSASQAVPTETNIYDPEEYEMEQDEVDDGDSEEKTRLQGKVEEMEARDPFKAPMMKPLQVTNYYLDPNKPPPNSQIVKVREAW